MKHRISIVAFFVWALGLIALTALACSIWLQLYDQLAPVSATVNSPADAPYKTIQGLNLYDGRIIRQRFVAANTFISHIAIGVASLRDATPHALVTVVLQDATGKSLGQTTAPLSEFWPDDVTPLPLKAVTTPGQPYWLRIYSSDVPKGNDASVFFLGDPAEYSPGKLVIELEDGTSRPINGNIGFEIYASFSPKDVWLAFFNSLEGQVASAAILSLFAAGIAFFMLRLRTPELLAPISRLCAPLPLTIRKTSVKDLLLFSVTGLALAFTVTAPFYASHSPSSIYGDIHRALTYRAVARDSLLQSGQMGLWEPYLCGGTPLLANAESAQLDPLFLLVLAFGPNLGLRLSVTFMLAIGFVATCVLARTFFTSGRIEALLAGGIFSFSGFQMLGFSEGTYAWLPVGWIPLVILFTLLAMRKWQWVLPAAIAATFLFFGGGIHMSIWGAIAVTFLACILTITYRSARPLISLLLIGTTALGLASIKLLPALELQSVTDIARPPAFVPPLSWLPKMFIDRSQLETPPWFYEPARDYFRWYDFGSYIGVVPVILLAASFMLIRRRKLLISIWILLLLTLLMTYGYPPWSWLVKNHSLAEILRNPQRVRAIGVLCVGIIIAFTTTQIKHWIPFRKFRLVPTILLVMFVLADLITFHQNRFNETFALPPAAIPKAPRFERLDRSYDGENSAHYKASYDTYLAGYGTTDSCLPFLTSTQSARGSDSQNPAKPYRGEAYLTNGTRANLSFKAPNEFVIQLPEHNSHWLMVNMNYFPGWQTIPPRQVWNQAGVLAIPIKHSDTSIALRYNPLSYQIGRLLTILTLLVSIIGTYTLPQSNFSQNKKGPSTM